MIVAQWVKRFRRHHRLRPLITIGAVGVVIVLASAGTLLLIRANQIPQVLGVSASELLQGGLVLTSPPIATFTKVSEAHAKAIASQNGQIPLRGAILARFHFVPNSSVDCLCWVVSLRPGPGGFSGPPGLPGSSPRTYAVRYYLVFVDAETGRVTYSRMAGMPSAARPQRGRGDRANDG
jgi:hypothetical protein